MLPVEFTKRLCRPVEFKGQGPHSIDLSSCLDHFSLEISGHQGHLNLQCCMSNF